MPSLTTNIIIYVNLIIQIKWRKGEPSIHINKHNCVFHLPTSYNNHSISITLTFDLFVEKRRRKMLVKNVHLINDLEKFPYGATTFSFDMK